MNCSSAGECVCECAPTFSERSWLRGADEGRADEVDSDTLRYRPIISAWSLARAAVAEAGWGRKTNEKECRFSDGQCSLP